MTSDILAVALILIIVIFLAIVSVKLGLVTVPDKKENPGMTFWILISVPVIIGVFFYGNH
ncbi:hypothetical protein DN062_10165 [Nitrincola tibetensis]|uniref:Uncharacterized protein n=1 Tax=Nitrincola tibetensis TaxID=2219697 RepID=A0A364NMM0_9GAMM|nr:hypothetical protein [Nitrincola tibetensis]RAU18135.1 hypothetical protein DN062_10165 [Nitrincola tibetensis]